MAQHYLVEPCSSPAGLQETRDVAHRYFWHICAQCDSYGGSVAGSLQMGNLSFGWDGVRHGLPPAARRLSVARDLEDTTVDWTLGSLLHSVHLPRFSPASGAVSGEDV